MALLLAVLAASAQRSSPPLQANLQAPLDVAKVSPGAPVYATVLASWHGPDCTLKPGANVYGHVVESASRTGAAVASHMTMVIDHADCNGQHNVPVPLLLYAIVDTTQNPETVAMRDRQGLFGSFSPRAPMVAGGGAPAHSPINMTAEARDDASIRTKNAVPTSIRAGQVYGMGKVTMSVGTGAEGGSVLSSPQKTFALRNGAQLVLVARPEVHDLPATPGTRAAVEPLAEDLPPPPPPPRPVDQTELCNANCSSIVDMATPGAATPAPGTEHSIAITRFGYRPTHHDEISAFDRDATVTYLSADQLLLTFDAHRLRRRFGEDWPPSMRRMVRALLIDTRTSTVKRAVEWEVDEDGAYLWPISGGRVLVSMQGALREIGPDLKVLTSIPIQGRVEWVVASPASGYVAIGERRERHPREVHQRIASLTRMNPEEDLVVQLLGPDGKVASTTVGSSGSPEPVLTDTGELYARPLSISRWQVAERGWNGSDRSVADINSSCAPLLSAPAAGDIFVVGCDADRGRRWYRMVRLNGTTVLKSSPSSQILEPVAAGGAGPIFAVRVVHSVVSSARGGIVHLQQLSGETIGVYRSSDGREVFSANIDSFPATRDNFALAPDGLQLAVLTRGEIEFFKVPSS